MSESKMSESLKSLQKFRKEITNAKFTNHTSGVFTKYAQANVVILPKAHAESFSKFCSLNPIPCPVIFESKPGEYMLNELGNIDIRYDVPMYNVYKNGLLAEQSTDIARFWNEEMVGFYLGCSFTFEKPLTEAGIVMRHEQKKKNVAMYNTNIALKSAPPFAGNMVVSMRYIPEQQVDEAIKITARYPHFHGKPVHYGVAKEIGITNITKPDYGEYVEPEKNDVAVFWGCGVTPQASIKAAKLPLAITHKPGSMLITNHTHLQILDLMKNKRPPVTIAK